MPPLDYLIDLHLPAERQGPGSEADTLRALSFVDIAGQKGLRIADIGCGSGSQTRTLARALDGQITAVDLFPAFLARLDEEARQAGLAHKIQTLAASMDDLPFEAESLDLIWSEGAIYNMGFEAGLQAWRQFLKPGGYLAVSEITWLTPTRPAEIQAFWEGEYPEIALASTKIQQLEAHGYALRGYFVLSPASWLETYYQPMEARFEAFLEKHGQAEAARQVVAEHRAEIALYRQYQDCYSYGFYVAQKV